jgi:hypothetical protein
MLPPVIADARALRQIALNLIGNSIHLANAGGQVIVSTALSDFGEVMLRVRDTGHGLNDNEVAAALQPFRTPAPSDPGREFGRQPVADQGAGRSQPRQIPDQDRRPFRHADRDRVSARGGARLTSAGYRSRRCRAFLSPWCGNVAVQPQGARHKISKNNPMQSRTGRGRGT